MSDRPIVSIVIPCRNEGKFIDGCLRSIVANDYPKNRLEVLVVDGMSEDETRATVQHYVRDHAFVRLLDNPNRITPTALNIGIGAAKGEIIMRMDAHSTFPPEYVSRLVDWLQRTQADNVGGAWITAPAEPTPMAEAIALALSHPFGIGNAYFRIGVKEPKWVDTVPFGCYRRDVFDRVGLFDEELARNQDDEFNLRLLKKGGRILLIPDVVSYYHARDSLHKLWRMYYQYGYFKPLVVRKVGRLTIRQVIPATLVFSLLATGAVAPWSVHARGLFVGIVLAYVIANLSTSFFISLRRSVKLALPLAVVFPVLHLSYGAGYLLGIVDHLILRRNRRKNAAEVPITR